MIRIKSTGQQTCYSQLKLDVEVRVKCITTTNTTHPVQLCFLLPGQANWQLSCRAGQVAGAAAVNQTDEEIAEEGPDAGNETEEKNTEKSVENPRNSQAFEICCVS